VQFICPTPLLNCLVTGNSNNKRNALNSTFLTLSFHSFPSLLVRSPSVIFSISDLLLELSGVLNLYFIGLLYTLFFSLMIFILSW